MIYAMFPVVQPIHAEKQGLGMSSELIFGLF